MKHSTNPDLAHQFFVYLFNTRAKFLPDKLQRARQALESIETGHVIFEAIQTCAKEIEGAALHSAFIRAYIEIIQKLTSNGERHAQDALADPDGKPRHERKRKVDEFLTANSFSFLEGDQLPVPLQSQNVSYSSNGAGEKKKPGRPKKHQVVVSV
jgi:hypothetical protein